MGVKSSNDKNVKINEHKKRYYLCCGSRTLPSEREEDLDDLNNLNLNNNSGTIIINYNYEDYSSRIISENVINFHIFANQNPNITPIEANFICNYTQTSPKNESNDNKSNNFNTLQSNMIKNDEIHLINTDNNINNNNESEFKKNSWANDMNEQIVEDDENYITLKNNSVKGYENNKKEADINHKERLKKIHKKDKKEQNFIEIKEENQNYEENNNNENENDNNDFRLISFENINIEKTNKGLSNKKEEENDNSQKDNLNIEIDNDKISTIVTSMFEMFPNLKQVNNPIAIIYKSNLTKLINIPERKNLNRTVERFCLITKENFFIFHSYDSYIRVQPPLGILPINSIKSCVQFKVRENVLNYDHFYIEYELNDNTRQFYQKINNFYLNNNSKTEPILLFKSNDSNIIKNWYILLNFFISLEK